MRNCVRFSPLAAFCLLLVTACPGQRTKFVDPFLGSDGGGNVFPGATLPFGMLKAGPDTGDNTANSGWSSEPINGFSQTHVSGTGGGAKYGNILLQPTTGQISPADHSSGRLKEQATPGFYGVTLERYNIRVDIASARRSALYRFTYPPGVAANLLIDAGHCLASGQSHGEGQVITSSSVEVLSATEVSGFTSVKGGWNKQPKPYTVFFYAVSDKPAEHVGTWRDGVAQREVRRQAAQDGSKTGAWLTFVSRGRRTVRVKVGISFISVDQAKRNAQTEIEAFNFNRVRSQAKAAWEKALAPVSVKGVSDDDRRQLYTALYHTMLMPTDRTGENPLFESREPSYDDFYAIWDTFRSSNPLLTLVAEKRETEIVRSLVDLYRHEGWLPDARSGNYNGRVQGGSDADMTIADGYLKHLPGVDWDTAYKAVVNDAEHSPEDPDKEGRGDLEDWREQGYLTIEGTDRPASKHMEYAANDYAIALMARGLGKEADERKYSQRAANWKNLWDMDATDQGFQGFIWPRHRDGKWAIDFKPLVSGTWGGNNFYEGNSWTYSTFVPQDVAGLIAASGGNARFVERMDAFFDPGRYDVSNEPGFLAPYLYLWAGKPDHTQSRIRRILSRSYHSGLNGLPGNDDSGAMSSWYVFGKMGFYPNAAQDVYLIGSPAYRRVSILLSNGKLLMIETEKNGPDKPYIASALWNGTPYNKAWFTHEQLMQGGVLRFKMSATPTTWGADAPPPSMTKAVTKP